MHKQAQDLPPPTTLICGSLHPFQEAGLASTAGGCRHLQLYQLTLEFSPYLWGWSHSLGLLSDRSFEELSPWELKQSLLSKQAHSVGKAVMEQLEGSFLPPSNTQALIIGSQKHQLNQPFLSCSKLLKGFERRLGVSRQRPTAAGSWQEPPGQMIPLPARWRLRGSSSPCSPQLLDDFNSFRAVQN